MIERLHSDPRRDASASIRGYVYQAYQSVSAWMHLGPGDELFLEAAEDFDVHSPREATATQVKDRPGKNVTLRSADILQAIDNFFGHVANNSSRRIRLRFLTTADRGQEMESGLDRAGLDYWDAAAAGAAPVGPLRTFLATLPLSSGAKAFIERATDDSLRADVLTRIEWDTGNRPLEGLKASIEEDLISHGERFGVPPTEAARSAENLVAEVFDLLCSKGERRLTHAGFARAFEAATMAMVPRGQAESTRALKESQRLFELPCLVETPAVLEPGIPLVRGAVPRAGLVDSLAATLRSHGVLHLWGGTGLGKTSIASLVSGRFEDEFVWTGFRDLDPSRIAQRLIAAARELRGLGRPPELVLDDLDLGSVARFERELLRVVFLVRRLGGRIITTGYEPWPAELLEKAWLHAECCRQIPHMDAGDVTEFLVSSGAPSGDYISTFTALILAATSGHPQLVHARIKRLASEGWPQPSASSLFRDESVAAIQRQARLRLREDLPADGTRVLAFRLSLAIGTFTRSHALSVATVAPQVSLPGESLDLLVGPWVERLGPDVFRISPLLGSAGVETLSAPEVAAVHEAFALHPFRKANIAPVEIGPGLLHALIAPSRVALSQFTQLLLKTKFESIPGLGESLFVLAGMALEPGARLYCGDAALEVMLRIVQFKTAAAIGNAEAAIRSVDRTMEALAEVEGELRPHLEVLAFTSVLINITVPTPPSRTVPMLASFMRMPEHDSQLAEMLRNLSTSLPGPEGGAPTLTPFQVLFQFEAARMDSIAGLDSFLTEVSKLAEEDRSHLLGACRVEMTASLLVNNAWNKDAQRERLNPDRAVVVCERAIACGVAWGSRELTRAAFVAVAVLHDEYRHDPEAALATLQRAALAIGGDDGRILIGQGKVHYGKKQWAAAVDALEKGLDDHSIDGIDRVFGARLLAISNANLGTWGRAAETFLMAATTARQQQLPLVSMAVGLNADAAYAKWRHGDATGAVRLFADVLAELREVPVDGDLRNRHVHATVRHAITWVWAIETQRQAPPMAEPPPGMCSSQEPHKGMADFEIRDIDSVWALLAATDERVGAGQGIALTVQGRSSGPTPIVVQAAVRSSALDSLRRGRGLRDAPWRIIQVLESVVAQRAATGSGAVWERKEIGPLPADYWDDLSRRDYLSRLLIAVGVIATAEGLNPLPGDEWNDQLRRGGALRDGVARTVVLMSDDCESPGDSLLERAASAIARLRRGGVPNRELFSCHFRLLNALEGGDVEYLAGDSLAKLTESWRAIAQTQRFSLVAPDANCPTIEERFRETTRTGLSRVAAILDVVAPAIGVRLDTSGRDFLVRMMNRPRSEPMA